MLPLNPTDRAKLEAALNPTGCLAVAIICPCAALFGGFALFMPSVFQHVWPVLLMVPLTLSIFLAAFSYQNRKLHADLRNNQKALLRGVVCNKRERPANRSIHTQLILSLSPSMTPSTSP